jgi:hypothetical protein
MPSSAQQNEIDFTMNSKNLYRDESYTDIKVGALRRLVPVNSDGSEDDSRSPMFMAQTQVMSPAGPIVLNAPLKATTIEDAVDEFPAVMQAELERMKAEAEKRQAQEGGQSGPSGS